MEPKPPAGTERVHGSTWQSLARRTGSIEAEYINGEFVLLGRTHGVPTPVNETLLRLVDVSARERRAPGSTAATEILKLVDALP